MENKTEKDVFKFCESHGDFENENLHILNTGGDHSEDVFRIYTKGGNCITVSREYVCDEDEVDDYGGVDADGYLYSYFDDSFDGFVSITPTEFFELYGNN